MDFKSFIEANATDENLENEGVWVEIGKGVEFRIARLGNRRSQELYQKLTANPSIQRKLKRNQIEDEEGRALLIDIYARTVLLDWRGLTENGEPLPYSVAKAKELLQTKSIFQTVQEFAQAEELFRDQAVDDNIESLKKSSTGISGMEAKNSS